MKIRQFAMHCMVAAFAFGAAPLHAEDAVKVTFGISARSPAFLLPILAKEEGLFAKQGITDIDVTFGPGPQTSAALAGGAFDMTMTAAPAVDLVAMTSARAKVLAVSETHSAQSLLGAPGVASVRDLKGRKVAISGGKGSATSMLVAAALHREGMSLDDITLIVLQDSGAATKAFLSEQVDAVASFPPNLTRLIDGRPGTQVIDNLDDIVLPGAQFSVNDAWAKEHPDTVVGLLRALDESMQLFKSDPERGKALIAAQLNLQDNPELVEQLYDYADTYMLDRLTVVDEPLQRSVMDLLRLSGFAEATDDKIPNIIAPEYALKALAQ